MKILVTGTAGFIGYHLAARLLRDGCEVIGVDNLNDYYDVALKQARLDLLNRYDAYRHHTADIADRGFIAALMTEVKPEVVVNLAAQAGVRYAAVNPFAYTHSNIDGFLSILEACRSTPPRHLVFASTSSVYGLNQTLPFAEGQGADHPVSLYAATKRANELMAHSYAALLGLPVTGLRFFTVYGPWGRPDMALFEFTRRMLAGQPIPVYNHGEHARAFTFIDDIVEAVVRVIHAPPAANPRWDARTPDPATSSAPYRIYNIGGERSIPLLDYIRALEVCLGRTATCEFLPMQPGDIKEASADTSALEQAFGFAPRIGIEQGIRAFVDWYLAYTRQDGAALAAFAG